MTTETTEALSPEVGLGADLAPSANPETGAALDAMFKGVEEEAAKVIEQAKPDPKPDPEPEKPKVEEVTIAAKPEKGKVIPEVVLPKVETVVPPKPKDRLDDIETPPLVKPKTAEAFATIKKIAREHISELENKVADLTKKFTEAQEAVTKAPPPEALKELEELRKFKQSVDIENDPEFKTKFESAIQSNNDGIYKRLAEAGMSEEQIARIKEVGGPDQVDWEPIFPKLPAQLKRLIEAKLVQNEGLKDERQKAIENAKKNADQFFKERTESKTKSVEKEREILVSFSNELLKQLEWTKFQEPKADATPEQKAQAETHNKFVKDSEARLSEFLTDRSPEMHAQLAVSTIQAFRFKNDLENAAKHITTITGQLEEAKAELDKIKKASQTHRKSAIVGEVSHLPSDMFGKDAGSALDELRKSIAQ